MAFTDAEIQEIKNLLGYGNLTVGARPYFDIASIFETIVQQNCDAFGQTLVTGTILVNIRAVDARLAPTAIGPRLMVNKVAEAELNPREMKDLLSLRGYWLDRLSETVQVPRVPKQACGSDLELG